MYSGNLGRAHDFTWVAPLAARFRNAPQIAFVFIGMGSRLIEVQKTVGEAGLSNVHYFPSAPRSDLATVLSAGDVHFVSIRAGCENLVFPSKLAGIAVVGRPAMVIGPTNCEPARIVSSGGWGRGFTTTDIEGMDGALRSWTENPAELEQMNQKALVASTHSRFELALSAWERILNPNGGSPRAVKDFLAAS
jgi:glycosyltransferase involved in cell wall biosynthesis